MADERQTTRRKALRCIEVEKMLAAREEKA